MHTSSCTIQLGAKREGSRAYSHQVQVTNSSDHLAEQEEEAQPGQVKGQRG